MRDAEDSNALIMTAEIALQRDDCGRAAANYTIAAQRLADAKLAERAAEVALDCGQYQAAERAAARWRQLTADRSGGAARRDAGRPGSLQDRRCPQCLRGLDQERRRLRASERAASPATTGDSRRAPALGAMTSLIS